MRSALAGLGLVLLVACGGGVTPIPDRDAGARDAATLDAATLDAATLDAATFDASTHDASTHDAATHDAATHDAAHDAGRDAALAPLFDVSGSCGVLDTELRDALPHWFQNTATFPTGWTIAEASRLSPGAQTILAEGTAGGSSSYSEAFAFEMLARCEGADLLRSETMIRYSVPMPGAITDMLVEIGGERVGVSVTRGVTVTGRCTRADTYDPMIASDLLTRKLEGILESSRLVAAEDAWTKQILFIYADTSAHASTLMSAWASLDTSVRADTILYVSVSEAMDGFIYFEDRCP